NGAVKAGVRFDPGDDADVVGLGGVAVEDDGEALGRRPQGDDFHRRPDGDADRRLGDAVTLQDVALSLGGAAAAAAHGGGSAEGGREPFWGGGGGPGGGGGVGASQGCRGARRA